MDFSTRLAKNLGLWLCPSFPVSVRVMTSTSPPLSAFRNADMKSSWFAPTKMGFLLWKKSLTLEGTSSTGIPLSDLIKSKRDSAGSMKKSPVIMTESTILRSSPFG
ncbi:MAG: hypothetical protein RXR41_04915 [Candidatus Marsarchaeota archaeon]